MVSRAILILAACAVASVPTAAATSHTDNVNSEQVAQAAGPNDGRQEDHTGNYVVSAMDDE